MEDYRRNSLTLFPEQSEMEAPATSRDVDPAVTAGRDVAAAEGTNVGAEGTVRRGKGRPKGSGKLQSLISLGGLALETAGSKFKPHAITIQTGEDIVRSILQFSQRGGRSICVLSAIGPVSSVDVYAPHSFGGILRYKGHYEILSLSGSHALVDRKGASREANLLNVSLANPDGQVFGGSVAGSLIAAAPVQLIIATFKRDLKNQLKANDSLPVPTSMQYDSGKSALQPTDGKRPDQ